MSKLYKIISRKVAFLLCFVTIGVYGQKQTKTYKETFNVNENTVLDINTSHSDIQFETWGKNEVEIEAVIEIEGGSEEEMKHYFEKTPIQIVGNSKKISISTEAENSWLFNHSADDFQNFNIEIPEIEPFIIELPEMPLMPELPPIPSIVIPNFDYDAYKKDGEEYLKKWQEDYEDKFDEKHQEKLEEWGKRMEEKQLIFEEKQRDAEEKRREILEKREEAMEENVNALEEHLKETGKHRKMIFKQHSNNPKIYYRSSGGKNKKYKVKKIIKVKMPKSLIIKMNVRHGEVKLAENTKNINAILSYSSLYAATIDGDKTTIMASYSPVSVQKWNYGKLQADYSEAVNLKEVMNLTLNSISSDVTIDHLINSAFIKNNFGALHINSVSKNFTDLNISLENAELVCKLPSTPYTIVANSINAEFIHPTNLTLNKTKNGNEILHKGYHVNNTSGKSIVINSKYSEVVLE